MLYPGSRFRMADDLLETYLRQLIEAHAASPEVVVAWQGGEPTMMGLDFFRRSVQLAAALKRPGQRIVHTIQTNGTLLNDQWGAFFAQNGFLVGLSIDGPREIHDTYRVDKGGKGSFDRVITGLAALRRNGVEWNALTTVHAANHDRGREVYRFLRDECGARFMQFIPIVERATAETLPAANLGWGERTKNRPLYTQRGSLVTERSVSPDGYGRFLIDVFEDWVRRDVGEVYVQMFDVALANWYGEPPGLCVHSETSHWRQNFGRVSRLARPTGDGTIRFWQQLVGMQWSKRRQAGAAAPVPTGPSSQLAQAGARGRRHRVSGVPQIVRGAARPGQPHPAP
jgi:uncharacterized protein